MTNLRPCFVKRSRSDGPLLGDEHPQTGTYLLNLAHVELLQGKAADAEPLARHALEILQRTLHEDDWRIANAESLVGGTLIGLAGTMRRSPCCLTLRGYSRTYPDRKPKRLVRTGSAWPRCKKRCTAIRQRVRPAAPFSLSNLAGFPLGFRLCVWKDKLDRGCVTYTLLNSLLW